MDLSLLNQKASALALAAEYGLDALAEAAILQGNADALSTVQALGGDLPANAVELLGRCPRRGPMMAELVRAGVSWRELTAYADDLAVADVEGLERARGSGHLLGCASASVVALLLARGVEAKLAHAESQAHPHAIRMLLPSIDVAELVASALLGTCSPVCAVMLPELAAHTTAAAALTAIVSAGAGLADVRRFLALRSLPDTVLHVVDVHRTTLLHLCRSADLVPLLATHVGVGKLDSRKRSALYFAVQRSLSVTRALLAAGARPDWDVPPPFKSLAVRQALAHFFQKALEQ